MNEIHTPVCQYCGSNEISALGAIEWNVKSQEWEHITGNRPTDLMCHNCRGPTTIKWRPGDVGYPA